MSLNPNLEQRKALHRAYQYAITPTMAEVAESSLGVARQFIPDIRELTVADYEVTDPIGDEIHSPLPHLIHRYTNRALWKIAPTCAVYCRFCFRKEHIGKKGEVVRHEDIHAAHQYLAAHREIDEVILSGGDPMTISPQRLQHFILPLREIPHIRRIRVHTRVPVVAPHYPVMAWQNVLAQAEKTLIYVLHINHADEMTAAAKAVIGELRAQVLLLSQSVLLKGVNDTVQTLVELFNTLIDCHIHPYYLHHLDPARGTEHFRLSLDEGQTLYRAVKRELSGIAIPSYIVELPGGAGKIAMMEMTAEQRAKLNTAGIF